MKRKAMAALAAMGLTASQAVRLLFHRIAVDQAFPLELKVPNAQTRRAMAESEEMMRRGTARSTSSAPAPTPSSSNDLGRKELDPAALLGGKPVVLETAAASICL